MDLGKQSSPNSLPVSGLDAAHANEYFEQFVNASSMKNILGYYRGITDNLHLRPNVFTAFYPKIKANLTSWRAKALLKKFDLRASHKCYQKGKLAANTRVLVIGGGPCGMRTAIEAQLLGAKVVVVEKRDRFSRNNVLHLWPFVIEDLRMLGAKKFFGKFCAGAIDHISIRQLQCILLKVALLLGIEIHTEVSFENLIEPDPDKKIGWTAEFKPSNHPVSQYEFDVIIGADGKRNTLQGFTRKEFRGKLAIAITANFINKKTEAEARVEEISGVAFIFNQKFFKDLQEATRIDLENIVYYKDDTHYFVMTAKKHSLIEKGVIKQDYPDTERLLAPENVDKEALQQYAIEAASFSTNYQMSNMEFAVNHYGQPDIAMFDFTSMYAAENASKVVERNGYRLLKILVGDSLLEPFWPTGSGCARGFLSALDAAWAIRSWSLGTSSPLDTMAERESIYRLLAQTTPDNLNKDWKSYTLDPATRYPNLNKAVVMPHQMICLFDTDNPASIERMKRTSNERPNEIPKKRKRGNVDNEVLLNWLTEQLKEKEGINITDMGSVFKDGRVLCAIIHHYRPDLLDISAINSDDPARNNQIAIDILESDLCIPPVMTGNELTVTEDYLTMATYLTEIYDCFRGEIPYIKHPKLHRNPKTTSIKLNDSCASPNNKTKEIPCRKCFNAYNLKCYHSKEIENKSNHTRSSVINPTEDSLQVNEKHLGVIYKKSSRRLHKKRIKKKIKITDPSECLKKIESNSQNLHSNEVFTLKKSNSSLVYSPEDLQRKCIEKIYSKHEKLKLFLTKMLLKRKNVENKSDNKENELIKCPSVLQNPSITNPNIAEQISTAIKLPEKIENDLEELSCSDKSIKTIFDKKSYEEKFSTTDQSERKDFSQMTSSLEKTIKIRFFNRNTNNKLTLQTIEYMSSSNQVSISSKTILRKISKKTRNFLLYPPGIVKDINIFRKKDYHGLNDVQSNCSCQFKFENLKRIHSRARKMLEVDAMPSQIYSRVSNWIRSNDFQCEENGKTEADTCSIISNSKITDITSVSKMDQYNDIIIEERTDVVNFSETKHLNSSEESFAEKLKNFNNNSFRNSSKYSQYSPFQYCGNLKSTSAPPTQFSVIVEGEEPELPPGSTKVSEVSYKTIKTATMQPQTSMQPSRPTSRHKHKHTDAISQKASSIERKPRKRRTLEKIGTSIEERQMILETIANNRAERHNKRRYQRKLQTEQFLKSMQMLQANAKPDSQPFEDYSIFLYRQTAAKFEDRVKDLEKQFTYIPDHENKPNQMSRSGGRDEDIAAKIKHLENKWRQPHQAEKKPKDLLRAIGKIETSDWNIKEIEKKILENKLGKPTKAMDKEKVPKWSKEQFVARQIKMEKQHLDRQNSGEAKFADIDRNIRNLDQKLKEGTVREMGTKKIATITEKLVSKIPVESKAPEKNVNRHPLVLPTQAASEFCHFCNKRVYLMERLSAEGRFFHHGCFKCQYCHVQLRLGSYAFDRDGLYGYKFFCLQHFGMIGETPPIKVTKKPSVKRHGEHRKTPEKKQLPVITSVDSIDKVQTPERIEFSNLSTGHISSDQEDSLNQMDEDEWTDKNFGGSCAELDDTDDDSSSISDTDSDDEDAYDDALEEPATKEGTLKWAERWKNSYSRRKNSDSNEYSSSSSDQSSYYDSSDDEESDTATEGEEEIRARELRKQEVCVEPPIVHTDTGTDTEIVSDETSSESSNEIHNSATEISTDSEFAQDDPTPTREFSILLNDFNVTKTRGSGGNIPKKIQVTSRYLQRPSDGKLKKPNIQLKLTPLVSSAQTVKKPAPITLSQPEGYVLNRTQSTGGIAAKVSLELKKKYLLGEPNPGSIQKSGSASTLDTKFKSFHTNISDCQKLLKPSTEISASMQTFCKKLNELKSPVSPHSSIILTKDLESIASPDKPKEPETVPVFENEPEGRPRSPLYETSIIVPQIDWSKQNESLTSDSLASSDSDNEKKAFGNIPRVEIFTAQDNEHHQEEFVPDSLHYFTEENPSIESPKSVTSEKKSLNQPKILPNLENLLPEIHNSLHTKYNVTKEIPETMTKSSALSSPESMAEQVTALTETELSDWARDELVSDDFEDGEFEINFKHSERPENDKKFNKPDFNLKRDGVFKDKVILTEAMNSILGVTLDNIEFMDTGTETSSDDGIANSQNGYVLFKNDDEYANDSLNPHINDILEAKNIHILSDTKKEPDQIKPNEPDDDSVVIVESGTTTEENTFTDSTVKNLTDLILSENNNLNKICELDDVKIEKKENIDNNIEFQEHCQRLKSKVEFSNVKDSIDVRKSRRKNSKPDILHQPDLITEEILKPTSSPSVPSKLHTPDILYNKEVIKKERDTNQKLIQEMVMNKMKAENKSLERRKRNKLIPSPRSPIELNKSASSIDVITQSPLAETVTRRSLFQYQPDILLPVKSSVQNLKSVNMDFINSESNETPKAPPRYNKRTSDEMDKKLEKLKQTVRLRNKENEHLLLKKDQLNGKREQSLRRCVSGNYESVPIVKAPENESLTTKAKSISDFPQKLTIVHPITFDIDRIKTYKSDPNILETIDKSKRKSQEKENRKSLTKLIAGFFTKKSPTSNASKGLFSRLSPKSKEISKSCANLDYSKDPIISCQRKSLSENFINRNVTPPPVPPLPINYVRKTDDSSDGEEDFKKQNDSSCDTLDNTGASVGSTASRRSSKSLRTSRQAQLKRHRMAQEIQRKLEETEVKTKELEDRGVQVEKALRGEGTDWSKDEPELLQEWFDLMRDRTELRRYERELTVRAQELELEDRHARLQYELRERIENDKPKTKDDVEAEENIINEMIKIVEKRDSLITEVEEDKIRYSHENRDLEEQMLAKGLRLTSVQISPEH